MGKLEEILEDILGEPQEKFAAVEHFRDLADWDSLQYVKIVIAIGREFDTEFSPEQIERLTSLAGIESVLAEKGLKP